ncbi:GGDEF domain-containing protein [Streptomyces sp.]|uniref:GGDEF domain-containing protein n=1 Tax=Streptomyces sp. TaxID=1931 RepID=UPI002D791EF9|nr:GGDEF domain-containing protein [Streptomyces sp.]HET6358022.1 GGDEF domain-containing protein [Streptomyces sp.]
MTGWTVHAVALHRKLATTRRDPLTGLLRRDGYTAKARRVIDRHAGTAAVVIVDLDHFKEINDRLGHAVGDRVLAATADRISAWAGNCAAVGRLGGDEFAITLRIGPPRREPRFSQLVQILADPVVLADGQSVDVAASVGAAVPGLIGTTDLSLLHRAADAALYDGKHSGRAVLATTPRQTAVPSVDSRRPGRPGTHALGHTPSPRSRRQSITGHDVASPRSGVCSHGQ